MARIESQLTPMTSRTTNKRQSFRSRRREEARELAGIATSSRRWLRVARAFTLIELLAVIVIMALIAAIGFPALKAMQGTALQTAARQFSNAMILARQYAINNRTPVRVALAVDVIITNAAGASASNNVCRAYGIYWRSNDVNGAEIGWYPLQDWRTLPTGVVFSDHATTTYQYATLDPITVIGANTRLLGTGSGAPTSQYFNNQTTMKIVANTLVVTNFINAGVTNAISFNPLTNLVTSCIEFSPTGTAAGPASPNGIAGVRLALGAVTIPLTRTIVINNASNWVYVEYDTNVGRVRIRYPETYQ